MILLGAAGTGKTTTIMVQEALLEFFNCTGAMKKSAPTNAAARLLKGNTLHATYKLPQGSLHGKRGKLSAPVLKIFRRAWSGKEAHVIDEISMVPPAHLYQSEVRARTATGKLDMKWGGLATELSGDFMQLPPIDVPSLAIPWEQLQTMIAELEAAMPQKNKRKVLTEAEALKKKQEDAEHRGGCELFNSIPLAVTLTLNMRTSGLLAQILEEMRAESLTDGSWHALQDRVLGVRRVNGTLKPIPAGQPDPRLLQPPFSNNPINYVVHRHVVRVSQAYVAAVQESVARHVRFFVVTAVDEVKAEDETKFTDEEKLAALRVPNPRHTHYLSGHLPLYIGMSVLLFGKACVKLGLMNGCECEVVHIILADEEDPLNAIRVGEPTALTYLPAGIVLRVKNADWKLPSSTMPPLPAGFDRRGVFVLHPSSNYFNFVTAKRETIGIRRTGFTILPASVRIVYNAQGESLSPLILDMARPPKMDERILWLACYVMLSRASSLKDLLILRLPTREQLSLGAPAYLVDAIERLLQLERKSNALMKQHLQQFCDVLPPEILQLFDDNAETKDSYREPLF